MRLVAPEPLTEAAFAPFGAVLAGGSGRVANEGTAAVRSFGALPGDRPGVDVQLAVFRCAPPARWPLPVALLERHPHSAQLFAPLGPASVVVVVAPGGDDPDLNGLRAFVPGPHQGVVYHPGAWHHPMIAVAPSDLVCLVREDGTAADCEVRRLAPTVAITRP